MSDILVISFDKCNCLFGDQATKLKLGHKLLWKVAQKEKCLGTAGGEEGKYELKSFETKLSLQVWFAEVQPPSSWQPLTLSLPQSLWKTNSLCPFKNT